MDQKICTRVIALWIGWVFLIACCYVIAAPPKYPTRPMRIIVPFPPGSSPDIVARIVANRLIEQVGQPVIVDPRPGGSGVIAVEIAKAAPPDGYTLLLAGTTRFVTLPVFKPRISYDPDKDFVTLSRVASVASTAVPAKTPAGTVKKLHAELVKAMQSPDVREQLAKQGATAHAESQAEFTAFIKAEHERIARVGRQVNITFD